MPSQAENSCCIVIPVYRIPLPETELASLANTMRLLGPYPIRLVCPQGLNPGRDPALAALLGEASSAQRNVEPLPLPARYFASTSTYNKLMLSPLFYKEFLDWNYILLVQLDAWLFSADLAPWLGLRCAYLGAPLLSLEDLPLGLSYPREAVGNGGLSLRHVAQHRHVLSSWRFRAWPVLGVRELLRAHAPLQPWASRPSVGSLLRMVNRLLLVLLRVTSWRNSLAYYARCGLNEDILLGLLVPRIFPRFYVPDPSIAARFSLDENPAFFAQRYLGPDRLPFGCHAWQKSYASFWRSLPARLPAPAPGSSAPPESSGADPA